MKKEKYLQIFNYLKEFSKIRSNPVRDIRNSETQYPIVIWLADIQKNELFECVTNPFFDPNSDYYIKIKKPKPPQISEPIFPKIVQPLDKWIEPLSLTRPGQIPQLKEKIVDNGVTYYLHDDPSIQELFSEYLSGKWLVASNNYRTEHNYYNQENEKYEQLNQTYKKFFSLYNKAEQFGEEFELLIGIGLFYFKENNESPLICRHILTFKVEIEFQPTQNDSSIKIVPGVESGFKIETDAIIDLYNLFDSTNIIAAERKLEELLKDEALLDDPFGPKMKSALQSFVERIRFDGVYCDTENFPKETPKIPTIIFSPSLILRKRDSRSFTSLYSSILNNINTADNDLDIPLINDLIELNSNPSIPADINGVLEPQQLQTESIYFPKKYNDEQVEIVVKSKNNNKVLVQGPPGTGKSHTIANLICDLLANGKRVLVTAYTKRALEVLHGQLPDEFQNLTVNLLSSDSKSLKGLESSVSNISSELSRADINEYRRKINKYELEIHEIRKKINATKSKWLDIKEKSTRRVALNDLYNGTLIEIAERIEKENTSFLWFKDNVPNINTINLIPEIECYKNLEKEYRKINIQDFSYDIPEISKLITISDLSRIKELENYIETKSHTIQKFKVKGVNDIDEINIKLDELLSLCKIYDKNDLSLKEKIIKENKNNLKIWHLKLNRSENLIGKHSVEQMLTYERNYECSYPVNKSLTQLKSDAGFLLEYLKDGNSLSGIGFNLRKPFLPNNIKDKLYFLESVKVNGSVCDTIHELTTVINDINLKQDFNEISHMWELPIADNVHLSQQLTTYQHVVTAAKELLNTLSLYYEILASIEGRLTIDLKIFDRVMIENIIEELQYHKNFSELDRLMIQVHSTFNKLSQQNIHPLSNDLLSALKMRNTSKYNQCLAELERINQAKLKYTQYEELENKLILQLPSLIQQLKNNEINAEQYSLLYNAILFNHAKNEITKLFSKGEEERLLQELNSFEQTEESLIALIASQKAWLHVIEKLKTNRSLQQYLEAWVMAIKKIGKTGTGKRALKFRKIAQQHMDKCKDSVPCWIMPLYKVAETVAPQVGMYDYIIIDEASQLGPDAIFLLYIGKKIIIVGDDKQTSPEYVGVDANAMTPHIHRHLQGIPFADHYGTEFSFFDHAKLFCEGMIVLREHFRCMPEIIEFSNKHFYANDGKGLYPLKQYSENRLKPLVAIHCPEGYIEGHAQAIINKVEAEYIADKISELVKDPRYDNKSFGVIALQGNKQGPLIENAILNKIGESEYQKRKLICGNSASFQGDERDIILLSLVTANNHNRAALVKPEDERRFNVAVSRAKEQIWLFHSIKLEDLANNEDLRFKLLDHFLNYKTQRVPVQSIIKKVHGNQPHPFESWFEVDVYNEIISKGYKAIPQYEVARGKYRIDLVLIMNNGVKLAIECDGDKFHGADEYQKDLMRQKVLERCGWRFFRIRGFEFYSSRINALQPLWELIESFKTVEPLNYEIVEEQPRSPIIVHDKQAEIHPQISDDDIINEVESIEPKNLFTQEQKLTNINNSTSDLKVAINHERPIVSTNNDNLQHQLIFTSKHNLYIIPQRLVNDRIPYFDKQVMENGEKGIFSVYTKEYSGFIILGYENGHVAKIDLSNYRKTVGNLKIQHVISNTSNLIFIDRILTDIDLVVTGNSRAVVFNTKNIHETSFDKTAGIPTLKFFDHGRASKIARVESVQIMNKEYYRKDIPHIGEYTKFSDII
jgi:very-short-patch-repair endonuclease